MSSVAEAQRAAGEQAEGLTTVDIMLSSEPRWIRIVRGIDRALAKVEEVALSIGLLVLLLVGVYGAVKRNFFPPAPFWTDEVIRYAVFYVGLFGAALAAQSRRLFNIDLFTRAFGVRAKLAVQVLSALFTIAVCWVFFKSAMSFLYPAVRDEPGELVPTRYGMMALPIAMVLISLHLILHIGIAVYYLATGKTPPEIHAAKVAH